MDMKIPHILPFLLCLFSFAQSTTTPTPLTCGPMTDASLDEDCSNARCVAVNSSCVTTSAGSRKCACVNKNVRLSATECSLGPSVLSSTTNYVFSTDLSRPSVSVGSIIFDGLSTFPTNTFSIEGEVYPDEGILDLKRNSRHIDVALVKEISSAKTFVVALRATSGEFTVQQVVTVRITSSSFTPEDVTVMLVEGTRKGTLIADVRTIGSFGGYSNFEMETTDDTARALFNVTTSGQVLCGQDMFLSDFTNNDTVAKEYIFSVKATNGGQRATTTTFYVLLFKSTFTTTLRENWKGNILSYTTTSSKFQVAIYGTLPDRLKLSKDLMTISLVKEIDYDAGITSINFKLDLVTTTSTKSTTVDVHINIEDQNDERPKIKKAVYDFSLLVGSKGNSIVGIVDVTDGDTVGQTTFSLEGRNKDDFSINDDGVLTSKVDLTIGRFPSAIPLRVKAYDGVSFSEEAIITVYLISYTINVVNLNKTFLGRVSENSAGAFVANVAVSNYTGYKFANPQADRFFSLNPTSGLVTTTVGLDRENDDQAYTAFIIQAYMDGGDQCSPVTIGQLITKITDVNDNAPEFSRPSYTGRVKENSIPGTLVVGLVDIAVTDKDTGVNGSVNFALTGTGKTYFAVEKLNHNQFTIKTSGTPIDREVTPYVVLTLTGTDNPSNPNTGTTTLNITIMDVNDNAPQFNRGTTIFSVEENVGPKIITTLTATDKDEGFNAKVSYSLIDGGFGFFHVDESTGEVLTVKAIDREKRKVFNLIIEAKDQGSPSLESELNITVNIRDVNDEKPAFTKTYYKGNYKENSSCDTSILTVTAIDQDEGSNANITFSTTSSNFTVDPLSGAIRCVIPLDYEEMQQHLMEIKAENPGFPTLSDTVTVEINVEDENDNSPRFDKAKYQSEITTLEWVTNSPVDVFEVTDDDSGTNGLFILSMSGETDTFYIDGDTVGVLRIKEGASQPVASTTYNFDVTATDKGSPSQSVTVPVLVDVKKIQGTSTVRFSSKDFRFSIEEEKIYTTSFGRANASHDVSVSVRYTLIHGGDFRINPSSGELTCSKAQDRETAANHTMVVRARDPATNASDVAVITVIILDINDNSPRFDKAKYQSEITTWDWAANNPVDVFEVTDDDSGTNGLFILSMSGETDTFYIDGDTVGVLRIKEGASQPVASTTYNFDVTATDKGSPSQSVTVPVSVDVKKIQGTRTVRFSSKDFRFSIEEEKIYTTSFGRVNAAHDSSVSVRYTLIHGGDFRIDPSSGALTFSKAQDRETATNHTMVVRASDPATDASDVAVITVIILDINDNSPRFGNAKYQSEITTWDWAANNPVDVFEVTDDDSGTNGLFILSMSGETDTFYIDGDTVGLLRIKEGASQPVASTTYNFDVTATDKGSPSQSVTVPVSVDVKKIQGTRTVRFSSKDFRFSIEEEKLYTTSFGRANASHDVSVSVRYTLIHGGDFRIDPSTGALTCSEAQDRETAANHTMVVRARDIATNASDVAVITVIILDVNDNGPKFLASSGQLVFQVEENSPGKEIGRIIAKDGDANENGRITYSIESQTPRTHFSINPGTGSVTVSGDLDREAFDTYNLIIKATDNGDAPRTATTSATILVLDINDKPPTFLTSYAVKVKEDSAISTSVETVSATDGDLAQHGAIVYSSNTGMVNGTVCPFNVSVETGVVKVSGDLDYETTSTYECIVTAVDMKGCNNCTGRLTGSTTMFVTILDFNDNPPVFQGAPYRANISRDANINTNVTDVITATDRDSVNDGNGVVTYHILSNINYFRINRTSGRLYVATTLDLDKVNDDEVTLRIKATDRPQKDPAMEAITNITISILTDEPRPFFNKTYTFMLTENEKPDEDKPVSIRAFVRRSSEEECNCTYNIIGSDNSSFYIDSMTGDLRQKDPIDREKTGSRFYLKVKAKDRGSRLHRTTDVEVNVKDVNDNLPYFNNTQQNFIVYQSAPAGYVIGRVMSVDADELSHPIYTAFTDVEGIELLGNGTLVVRASLSNYTEVDMIVSVTEGNFTGPINILAVTTTKASIEVRPDDYNEHAPVFGKVAYEASLEFSSETGTEVKITNFRATDTDGHNVTYAIQTRNDRENLKIDGQTGKISVHIKFDDTVPEVIKLVIIATDESPYPKTGSCTVTITLQGYTPTKCVAENAYSQLQQQRELFLGFIIAMAALLAVISIAAVFAIYKWRTVRRRTQCQENINTAHGKTTKSSGQAGYDSLAAGSKDEETAYNKLKDKDFSSGVPNPAYVSTGPRPTCTPPTDPLPDYNDEDANRM